ncbi:MAG: hypothetical protein J2P57_22665 [Acidimicrobiaceae bacterium]|nr:hypothetical protein [Acidimicrobiaceae bacterium]
MIATRSRLRRHPRWLRPKRRDERGEGVISAAIAVLVMAFIGVAMWLAFSATFQHAAKNVNNQVNCIGQTSSTC